MPKKRKPVIVEPSEPTIFDPLEQDISAALSGLPTEGASVNLFRYPPGEKGGRPAFVAELEPSAFRMQTVQEQYGGGRFFFKVIGDGEVLTKGEFRVEGPPKFSPPYLDDRVEDISDLYQLPQTGDAAILALTQKIDKLLEANSGAMMERVLELFQKSQKPVSQEDIEDRLLERMVKLKEIVGAGGQSPISTEIIGLAKELAGLMGQSEQPSWMVLLEKFGDKLTPILEALTRTQTGPAPARKAVPAGPVTEGIKPTMLPDGVADLIGLVPNLMNGASKNADPAFYADFVLDQLPPDKVALLKDFLKSEESLTILSGYIPPIRFQMNWWAELRKELLEGIPAHAHQESGESGKPATPGEESDFDGSNAL